MVLKQMKFLLRWSHCIWWPVASKWNFDVWCEEA